METSYRAYFDAIHVAAPNAIFSYYKCHSTHRLLGFNPREIPFIRPKGDSTSHKFNLTITVFPLNTSPFIDIELPFPDRSRIGSMSAVRYRKARLEALLFAGN
jgi:hypothetical protein